MLDTNKDFYCLLDYYYMDLTKALTAISVQAEKGYCSENEDYKEFKKWLLSVSIVGENQNLNSEVFYSNFINWSKTKNFESQPLEDFTNYKCANIIESLSRRIMFDLEVGIRTH